MSICQSCSDEIRSAVFGKPHGPADQLSILHGLLMGESTASAPEAKPEPDPEPEIEISEASDNAVGEGSRW